MRYRQFARSGEGPTSGAREAQIMIGHPNNSGLQMDQVTQLYIPAFFVNELRLWQDDSPVLAMEGGISISEDPNIRFTYVSNGAKRFRAEAKDTEATSSNNEWKVDVRHLMRAAQRSGVPRNTYFGFGLGAPEIVEGTRGLFGGAELAAEVSPDLRHAQHGFGRDVAVIRHQRCDDSIEQEHCSIACRVSPFAFRQPNTYSARAEVG